MTFVYLVISHHYSRLKLQPIKETLKYNNLRSTGDKRRSTYKMKMLLWSAVFKEISKSSGSWGGALTNTLTFGRRKQKEEERTSRKKKECPGSSSNRKKINGK